MANSPLAHLTTLCKGFAMAFGELSAGLYCGGATTALALGIYERWLASLANLASGLVLLAKFRFKEASAKVDFPFLGPLGLGMFLALGLMSKLTGLFLESYPEVSKGLLLGIITGSALLVGRYINETRLHLYAIAICSALFSALLCTSMPVELPNHPLLYFISGALAACAMVLPGLSASFILILLGKYVLLAQALQDSIGAGWMMLSKMIVGDVSATTVAWQVLNHNLLKIVLPFGLGGIVCLLTLSPCLQLLHRYHRNMTMSVVLGFMLGSLQKLWPFREVILYRHSPGKPDQILQDVAVVPYWDSSLHLCALACIALGLGMVLVWERLTSQRHP